MLLVLVLADQRAEVVSFPWSDKLAHLLLYGLLGLLCLRATHGGLRAPQRGPTTLAILITVAFGAIDEWNQTRFPHRDPSFMDWVADTVGAVTAATVVWIGSLRRRAG